jgi:hypothetical protein
LSKRDVSSRPFLRGKLTDFCPGDRFQKAKENNLYEDELYFISQMFEDDWQPRESIIDFDDGTVNNVPLREYG